MLNAKQIAETFFDRLATHNNAVADLFAADMQWNLPGDNSYDRQEPINTDIARSTLFSHLWPEGPPVESRAMGSRLMISDRQIALFGQINEKSTATSKRKIHDVAFHLVIENGAIRHLHMYEDIMAAIVAFDLMNDVPQRQAVA